MRYRLRTLLILLAIMPPALATAWQRYCRWTFERRVAAVMAQIDKSLAESREIIPVPAEDWDQLIARRLRIRCTPTDLETSVEASDEK